MGHFITDKNKTYKKLELPGELGVGPNNKSQGREIAAYRWYSLYKNSKHLNELKGWRGGLQRYKLNGICTGVNLY